MTHPSAAEHCNSSLESFISAGVFTFDPIQRPDAEIKTSPFGIRKLPFGKVLDQLFLADKAKYLGDSQNHPLHTTPTWQFSKVHIRNRMRKCKRASAKNAHSHSP